MCEICSLSTDVLIIIFNQLPVNELISNLQFVCKRFHDVTHHPYLWYLIFEQNIKSERFLLLLGSKNAVDIYDINVGDRYNMPNVMSYLMCHSCNKFFLESGRIYYCKCYAQTCYHCQDKISSYGCKCMSCAKSRVISCDQCHKIIPYSVKTLKTECCQKTFCLQCAETYQFKSKRHGDGHRTFICREHCYICEICGQWSTIQCIATCCQKTVCQMCRTICGGCQQYHCVDHCQDNKCMVDGCCFANRTTSCAYNGSICSQCHESITHTEMICHPDIQNKQKYCGSCFYNKTWICQTCNQIAPLCNLRMCDVCTKVQCISHMTQFRHNTKRVCPKCADNLFEMCDFCQQIYSVSMIEYVQTLKVCNTCVTNCLL